MQLHSVTKSLSRALVLLALVAFSASAFAQQRYVITNGEAVKRDHAYVGGKFLALDYSADAKNPTITMKESFDESCVWYCNGKPGYYYQLDAEGDRFYLMRTGQTLHVMPVLMGTQNEVFESATQWYDWTFGVATQELAGDARYYWVILNADGNSWGLSCDTYGRPGINNGDETNGHSNTATCAQYYADGTTPMVAATYTPLLAYEHEGVYEAQAGGIHSGATLNVASAIISGSSVDATVTGVTTYTSTAIPAYTEYQLREVFPAGQYPNFPGGLDAGTTADDYMYSGGSWYYRLFDVTNARQYTTQYYYEGAMHDAAPTAANSNPRTIVNTSWKLSGSGAHYLKVTPTAASTDAAPAATVTAVSPWSSTGMTATLTYSVTYSDGYTATLSQVIVLAVNPTAVAAVDVHATQGGEAPLSYTLTPAGATATVSISGVDGITYNNENNNINIASTVTPGDKTATITASKADGTTVNGTFHVYVHPAAPTVSDATADNDGMVTLTRANIAPSEGSIYYSKSPIAATTEATLTGLTEFTSSTSLKVNPGETIYLVSYVNNYRSIEATAYSCTVTSGTTADGTTIIINDLEDHNWSYYQPTDSLPTGYPSQLRSPDPRNVKITYRGGSVTGGSAVAISYLSNEQENTMVYYKTIEKTQVGMTGNYPYQVISNPFSKRPATGSGNNKQYYGFGGWKVISGGEYITEYSNNQTMPLDPIIHFTGLDANYAPNCMSAEIVLEATWVQATVRTNWYTPNSGTYETNFIIVNADASTDRYLPANVTVMGRNPDGTQAGNGNAVKLIGGDIDGYGNNGKIEWCKISGNVYANGYTMTVGRGVEPYRTTSGYIYGDARGAASTVKIESGVYSDLRNFSEGVSYTNTTVNQLMILGCDYDRAKGDNTKLKITTSMYVGRSINLRRSANSLYVRTIIKSGDFLSNQSVGTGAGGENTYYYSVANTDNAGRRYLLVEGGRLKGIAGGMDDVNTQTATSNGFDLRVRGTAQIDGVVYGAAEFAGARGIRTMVFTGGTINGWIAGGANGTRTTGGALTGTTYLYVGGKTRVDSEGSPDLINRAIGGNVFGAGCGFSSSSNSGQVSNGTNVVIADSAYVERGVYGGGSFGYTTSTANVYILGSKDIECKAGGVNTAGEAYSATLNGGVFGGACQNRGGTTKITMTGGKVSGSIYGGSNNAGDISSTATITVSGGNVKRNVFGGGLGSSTNVNGAVSVTVNGDAHIEGCVYGGGQDGKVNNSTTVKIESGTIDENVYGGGLGTAATVSGTTTVTIGK